MPKVDEIDLNGNSVPSETGQPETTENEEETPQEPKSEVEEPKIEEPQEDVETLKEKLKKVEEEKENYKQGMLKYKKRSLEPEVESKEEPEEEYPEWDETSKKFQKQTLSEAVRLAKQEATQTIEKTNENAAIDSFISKHPELEDDKKWSEVISNYHPKYGKQSIKSIERDLERAYFLSKYESGEINLAEEQAFKKGEQKGKAESQLADLNTVGRTTSKTPPKGTTLSPGALKLAEMMRVDPAKLAQEDDTLTAEIKF